uniref:FAD/NAD(P)-binding protein n=1 Tax=Chamaesiphon sp. OTE_8_metabat_110 TaxID=2964696 RepID=UPI00286C03D6
MQYSNLVVQTNLPAEQLTSGKCYDLAIIGAGISSAYTLIHYLELLEQRNSTSENADDFQPVKIIVTEKSGEFWTGIPYGNRSGQSCLLISPLIEFLPQPIERAHFTDWLNANRDWLFAPQTDDAGELATKWLQTNQADIMDGRWDDLFIPRQIFGLYLKQRVASLITDAVSKGLIEIDLVTTDVLDVDRDLMNINVEAGAYFATKKLVLAIGSPPNVAFERVNDEAANLCYIDNMYEPSLESNLDRICQSLAQQPDRQILIVGSNAGTLDTLYSLNDSPTLTGLVEKFIILSPNAAFPH